MLYIAQPLLLLQLSLSLLHLTDRVELTDEGSSTRDVLADFVTSDHFWSSEPILVAKIGLVGPFLFSQKWSVGQIFILNRSGRTVFTRTIYSVTGEPCIRIWARYLYGTGHNFPTVTSNGIKISTMYSSS